MFRSGMRESQEARVVLRDTDAGAFHLMLDFIYGGPVQLDQENIECVLELSVRFAVGVLIEQCCNFLASAVAVGTACAILILADVRAYVPACLRASGRVSWRAGVAGGWRVCTHITLGLTTESKHLTEIRLPAPAARHAALRRGAPAALLGQRPGALRAPAQGPARRGPLA